MLSAIEVLRRELEVRESASAGVLPDLDEKREAVRDAEYQLERAQAALEIAEDRNRDYMATVPALKAAIAAMERAIDVPAALHRGGHATVEEKAKRITDGLDTPTPKSLENAQLVLQIMREQGSPMFQWQIVEEFEDLLDTRHTRASVAKFVSDTFPLLFADGKVRRPPGEEAAGRRGRWEIA